MGTRVPLEALSPLVQREPEAEEAGRQQRGLPGLGHPGAHFTTNYICD